MSAAQQMTLQVQGAGSTCSCTSRRARSLTRVPESSSFAWMQTWDRQHNAVTTWGNVSLTSIHSSQWAQHLAQGSRQSNFCRSHEMRGGKR